MVQPWGVRTTCELDAVQLTRAPPRRAEGVTGKVHAERRSTTQRAIDPNISLQRDRLVRDVVRRTSCWHVGRPLRVSTLQKYEVATKVMPAEALPRFYPDCSNNIHLQLPHRK